MNYRLGEGRILTTFPICQSHVIQRKRQTLNARVQGFISTKYVSLIIKITEQSNKVNVKVFLYETHAMLD